MLVNQHILNVLIVERLKLNMANCITCKLFRRLWLLKLCCLSCCYCRPCCVKLHFSDVGTYVLLLWIVLALYYVLKRKLKSYILFMPNLLYSSNAIAFNVSLWNTTHLLKNSCNISLAGCDIIWNEKNNATTSQLKKYVKYLSLELFLFPRIIYFET